MKNNPESAQDTKVTIKWKRILKGRGNTDVKNPMTENPQSARETNTTT